MAALNHDHSKRLADLAAEIELALGAEVSVERTEGGPGRQVDIYPKSQRALRIGWIEFDQEVVPGTEGGRWELGVDSEEMDFLDRVVRSVIAGRVRKVSALGRSRVIVTFEDGQSVRTTTATAPEGCLPLPFWTRWGNRQSYEPYRS